MTDIIVQTVPSSVTVSTPTAPVAIPGAVPPTVVIATGNSTVVLQSPAVGSGVPTGIDRYVVAPASIGAAFTSVQAAIDQAVADGHDTSDPAVVIVLPGTYAEDVTLASGIAVRGMASAAETASVKAGASVVAGRVTATGPGSFYWSDVGIAATSGVGFTVLGTSPRVFISDCTITGNGAVSQSGSGVPIVWMRDAGLVSVDATAALSSSSFCVIYAVSCFINASTGTGLSSDFSAGIFQSLIGTASFGVTRTSGAAGLSIRAGNARAVGVAPLDLSGSGVHLLFNAAIETTATPAIIGTATVTIPDIIWPGSGTGFASSLTVNPVGGVTAGASAMIAGDQTGVRDPSAVLDLQSQTSGLLLPRMTAAQASAIGSPRDGLMVYATDTNATFTSVGFWGREAGAWVKL